MIDDQTVTSASDPEQGPEDHSEEKPVMKAGFVAIVGRPNVGKSTLLNHLLGQKISITSRKPQTTRHRILGIHTTATAQTIYVDTPGMHKKEPRAINRYMNQAADSALSGVDMVLFVIDALKWTDEDEWVLEKVRRASCPVFIVINKVDCLDDKAELLPHIERLSQQLPGAEVIPVSALRGNNLAHLQQQVELRLPEGVPLYEEDQITDRSERFLAAEIVREKVTRQLGDEVPYAMTVEIERFKREKRTLFINALILVERDGQKKILIGESGARLKRIGEEARKDMEKLFDQKVMLITWVKVKRGWSDDERALKSLGYGE